VFARSGDSDLRFVCLRALQRLDLEEAQNQLWRLAQDPSTGDTWRAICLRFFNGDTEPVQAGVPAGQQ
jgi:hypothetical protein